MPPKYCHRCFIKLDIPLTSNSIGFLCCPGQLCGPSLRKVGQVVLTYQQTKAIFPLFYEGGHNNEQLRECIILAQKVMIDFVL